MKSKGLVKILILPSQTVGRVRTNIAISLTLNRLLQFIFDVGFGRIWCFIGPISLHGFTFSAYQKLCIVPLYSGGEVTGLLGLEELIQGVGTRIVYCNSVEHLEIHS